MNDGIEDDLSSFIFHRSCLILHHSSLAEDAPMLTFSSLLLATVLAAADPEIQADVVIRGATLHDGSGKAGVVGDLAIKGERIVAVGTFKAAGTPKIIDGKGLIVAPGFIDLHTHSDNGIV